MKQARLMSFDVATFTSETAMPAAGYKCRLPLYSPVVVGDRREGMEAAVREEVSEKETQKSAFSASFAGLCVCTCVLASESPAASAERASGQTPCTLLVPLHV